MSARSKGRPRVKHVDVFDAWADAYQEMNGVKPAEPPKKLYGNRRYPDYSKSYRMNAWRGDFKELTRDAKCPRCKLVGFVEPALCYHEDDPRYDAMCVCKNCGYRGLMATRLKMKPAVGTARKIFEHMKGEADG